MKIHIQILLNTAWNRSSPEGADEYPESLVYKYELKANAQLISETFYIIDLATDELPQSIADYTFTYASNGTTVKETTVYFYEGTAAEVRASEATGDMRRQGRSFTGVTHWLERPMLLPAARS